MNAVEPQVRVLLADMAIAESLAKSPSHSMTNANFVPFVHHCAAICQLFKDTIGLAAPPPLKTAMNTLEESVRKAEVAIGPEGVHPAYDSDHPGPYDTYFAAARACLDAFEAAYAVLRDSE